MSDTILSGDVTIYTLGENRQKRIKWSGSATGTRTMNELYSAMATWLDETTTIDDGSCFSAETPTEYTTGKIDTGDNDPWYVSFKLMEHITGGALRTSGWTRATGTNTGIICVPVDPGGTITASDEGYTVTGATTGSGTLLEFIDTGSTNDYLMIRPDSSGAGDNFTTANQTITSARGSYTATQWDTSGSTTGEMIWANLYSLGTIDSNVHLYIYQGSVADDTDRVRRMSWNDVTQDWYANGHIDTTVTLKDIEATTWTIIDSGYVTVFARKYGDYYAHFEAACSTVSGGRNPIPMQTSADIDNTQGIKTVTFDGTNWTSGWEVGDRMRGDTSLACGVITKITNPGSTQTVEFIPIDDPQLSFTADEDVTNLDGTGKGALSGSPTSTGPADSSWFSANVTPTISFTHATADVDQDTTNENYGISINCQQNPLTEVYEWCKYATRASETTNDLDGINGECYIGGEVYLSWSGAVSGTVAEGHDVLQAGTGATGVIVAFSDSTDVILLRNTRGTFNTVGVVTDQDTSGTFTPTVVEAFAPKATSPLGTFAGGTFFGARGVLLTNYLAEDTNSFVLMPIEGGTVEAPPAITFEVTNLVGTAETASMDDRVAIFKLASSGGDILKDEYGVTGTPAAGDATLAVSTSITIDTPGKTAGGTLVVVKDPGSSTHAEYPIRFSSWSGSTFTLANIAEFACDSATTTTITESAKFTNTKRGDLVRNSTRSAISWVKTVDSANTITIYPAITGQTNGDNIELNCVPVALDTGDDVYVPILYKMAAAAIEQAGLTYDDTIYYRVKVRNTRTTTEIKPFSVDGTCSGTDVSVPVVRTEDTIIT